MANLKAIRNRVRTVKNTQKITRAMKLVAGAKLRRAQDAVTASRPYATMMQRVIGSITVTLGEDATHPLFRVEETPKRVLLVPMTSDRGLCGPFNSSILRTTEKYLKRSATVYEQIALAVVGRKGRDYFKRRDATLINDAVIENTVADLSSANVLGKLLTDRFAKGEYDEVYLVFNEFKSALSQEVVFEKLLPLDAAAFTAQADSGAYKANEYEFEPSRKELLEDMVPRYVESQIYRALLESYASETGSRMTAMDNATKNAGDLIDRLSLQMNRARQAAITTELMEITSGAEALKG